MQEIETYAIGMKEGFFLLKMLEVQKQPYRGGLRKICFENMHQI